MRSYIKSSFFMVLLLALFSVGFSSAHAKTVKKDKKVTKTANIKTVPLRCQMQPVKDLTMVFDFSSESSPNFLATLMARGCQPGTFKIGDNTVVVVDSDCNITIIQVQS